jgi:hypothetical protein
VVLNVTVTEPTSSGFVRVYGDGGPVPDASSLNYVAHQSVPNLVIAPVGANGMVALESASPGTAQLVADVSGWFLDNTVVPGPVTNVAAITTTTTIALSWTNPTPPASENDGSLVADVASPATSFTDTGLTPATQYSYTLFAHDGTPVYAAGAALTTSTR